MSMANRTKRTPEKDAEFFASVASGDPIGFAAEKVGYGRRTIYEWRDADEDFATRLDEANEAAIERMEAEADRRAIQGIDKPVHYQGERVDVIREFSDTLLIFRLKAKRPNVYRDNSKVEVEGNFTNKIVQAEPLTNEQWEALHGSPPAASNGHLNGHGSNGKANGSS